MIKGFNWQDLQGAPSPGATADLVSPSKDGGTLPTAPVSMLPPSTAAVAAAGNAPVPVYEPRLYGDGQVVPIAFAAAGDLLALARPARFQRVWLLIVNDLAASVIRVNFDNPASANVGIAIQPGANIFMDSGVPQNDIHIFSPIAGAITVAHMLLDVTNPSRILQNL